MTTAEAISRRVIQTFMPSLIQAATETTEFDRLDEKMSGLPAMLKPNDLLIVAGDHRSHADLAVVLEFARSIRRITGCVGNFYLPLAASVEEGQQGPIIQMLYLRGGKPAMLETNVYPLAVVTENDTARRGLKPNRRQTLEKLAKIIKEENSAIFVFQKQLLMEEDLIQRNREFMD